MNSAELEEPAIGLHAGQPPRRRSAASGASSRPSRSNAAMAKSWIATSATTS